ncbi:hypothetical protein [Streptomyces axinellae]|uniref:Uncharacterized protein n=1 Tax=Streptomyces axinellae TaxID=552788 RepID=A0ABN3QCY9_9ACTN
MRSDRTDYLPKFTREFWHPEAPGLVTCQGADAAGGNGDRVPQDVVLGIMEDVLNLRFSMLFRLAPGSVSVACHACFSWWPGERRRAVASSRSSEVGPDSGAAS